jgi:hypothetical protein
MSHWYTTPLWQGLLGSGSRFEDRIIEVDVTFSHLAELDSKLKWDWRNADWENIQKEVEQTVSYVRPREVVSEEKGHLFWVGYSRDDSGSGFWTVLDDSCAESCHEEAKPLGTHYWQK